MVLWFDDVEDDVLKDILETVNNAKDNNNIKDIINYKIKIQDLEIDLIQHQVYKGGLEIALRYLFFWQNTQARYSAKRKFTIPFGRNHIMVITTSL